MQLRPLNDIVCVKLDPLEPTRTSPGGIVLTEPELVRTGVVTRVGPGKHYVDGAYIPSQVTIGSRVAFFAANMDNKQGKAISNFIDDDEAIIPETSILFVIEASDGEELPRIER